MFCKTRPWAQFEPKPAHAGPASDVFQSQPVVDRTRLLVSARHCLIPLLGLRAGARAVPFDDAVARLSGQRHHARLVTTIRSARLQRSGRPRLERDTQ